MVFVRADSAEGQAIRAKAHAIALQIAQAYAAKVGMTIEVQEISPTHFGYNTVQMKPSEKITLDDNCALVFCGFYNNDSNNARVVEIKKGVKYLTQLNILPIAQFGEDKRGVDAGFTEWGVWKEGEDLSIGFKYPEPSTNVNAFLVGYAVLPEGKEDVVK